ncbi:FMN-linked oxidoreductase [Tothia fuscella]|uniref:FMN-linked oxidoreductase n=1 Tax=Tothia fuscella TaxID=1048955 RepID=A0A9P4U4D0_9PEZI|nr:FMN-linked oxidoreductase [Tothia fuscella]
MAAEPKRVPIPKNGVDYRGKVVLAPMVRSGELPSRLLALKYGADLVWGPETVDKAIIGTTRKVCERTSTVYWSRQPSNGFKNKELNPHNRESVIYRIHPTLESKQLIFQVGTASPTLAVQAARLVAGDVAGIDVNAGCPKPFSTSGGMGAALLQEPGKLCSILRALVEEVGKEFEIGISVKIRILDTPEETEALVRKLVATGITGLTVHCRTTPMRPRERAIRDQLRMIAGVCKEAGVACLMNGDVENREQALQLAEEYGVDGGMIATSAEKNSSVFRAKADGGPAPWREVVRHYIEYAMAVDNRWGNTKFLLAQLIPGKQQAPFRLDQCKTHVDLVNALGFEDLLSKARELDEITGMNIKPDVKSGRALKRAAAREANKSEAKKSKVQEVVNGQVDQEKEELTTAMAAAIAA